jgi:thiol-disulfide isomerase/thioredoxin
MKRLLAALVMIFGVGLGGALAQAPVAVAPAAAPVSDPRPATHALLGQKIPAFSAPGLKGARPLTDKELKGGWNVVLFWGVWCGDCQRDAAHTAALSRAIAAEKGLSFKTIHVDTRTGRFPSIDAYFDYNGARYPTWIDADRTVYKAFQMKWVPTYLVIDPQGVVRGYRTDLGVDTSPEGGVKAFMKEIAALKASKS